MPRLPYCNQPASGFVHDGTDYKLTGEHVEIDCNKCHTNMIPSVLNFAGAITPSDFDGKTTEFTNMEFADNRCKACHSNVHEANIDRWMGEIGCESCHNSSHWSTVSFDHYLTKFKLVGMHNEVSCNLCHIAKSDSSEMKIPLKLDKSSCDECHNESDFMFTSAHLTAKCAQCHTNQQYDNTPDICYF